MSLRTDQAIRAARLRGCLLGGAIGDALGYPLEFLSLNEIRTRHGDHGPADLVANADGVAPVSDDTQMTLFTAEGFRHGLVRERSKGIGGAMTVLVHNAYLRWLDTQNFPIPPPKEGLPHRVGRLRHERWLYARRAPGTACLTGLAAGYTPPPNAELTGRPGPVNPDSKGCGTVMRSAPFGFATYPAPAFELAATCAQITHGHPTGYYAAGAFAAMIACLMDGESLEGAVLRAMRLLARRPGHEETSDKLQQAVDLAAAGDATAERVESLGGGWVAEEALAIAVYAALAPVALPDFHPESEIAARLRLAVTHSGDSDSTGSVCGNLLGACHGDASLPWRWLSRVEGRAAIAMVADDLTVQTGQTRSS